MQSSVDLLVSATGDLVVGENGDLKIATPLQTVQQDILFRLGTAHHDFGPDPFVGANLQAYKGKPNTRRTGDYIKASVYEALTRDGRFTREMVGVDCVPVARNQVAVFVFILDLVMGLEDEIAERMPPPVATMTIDLGTGAVTSLTGGTY